MHRDGQSVHVRTQKGKPVKALGDKTLPYFGQYLKKRAEILAELYKETDLLNGNEKVCRQAMANCLCSATLMRGADSIPRQTNGILACIHFFSRPFDPCPNRASQRPLSRTYA